MPSFVATRPPPPKKGILKPAPTSTSTSTSTPTAPTAAPPILPDEPQDRYTPARRRAAIEQARYIQQQLRPAVPLEVFELLARFPLHRSPPPPPAAAAASTSAASFPSGPTAQQQPPPPPPPPPTSDPPSQLPSKQSLAPALTPTPAPAPTPARPHPADACAFRAALEGSGDSPDPVISASPGFAPRDYDDLVDERNCLGVCGYALCPRPRRSYGGEYKLRWFEAGGGGGSGGGGGGGGSERGSHTKDKKNNNTKKNPAGIASVADLNKWCSDDCARRALYVRLQLDDPTYVRGAAGRLVVRVELMVDEEEDEDEQESIKDAQQRHTSGGSSDASSGTHHTRRRETPVSQEEIALTKATDALALERGAKAMGLVDEEPVVIREKNPTEPAQAPDPKRLVHGSEQSHMVVEGHKIKFSVAPGYGADDDSD